MNIIEAYTKFKKQYIILISGFSGAGKAKLGKFLANLFKFKFINLSEFNLTKEMYDKEENYVTLPDGSKILDWDNIYKSVNWDSFNDYVDTYKGNGIVVTGFGFPQSKIRFTPDAHIHLKIQKKNLLEKRHEYLDTHPDDPNNTFKDTSLETMILNQITYPRYMSILEDSKLDKFINLVQTDPKNSSVLILRPEDEIKDEAFQYIINITSKWVNDYNKTVSKSAESNKNADLPYDGRKVLSYSGKSKVYDDYYLNKRIKGYDFNDEGIDYPESSKKSKKDITTSDSSNSSDSSDSSDSDMDFLMTTKD